ncbi:MAG: AEC family transporter [Alphaproteobacteria bacterium]|nr:MAG: AEC family transporter [Alphaproteobacteria bacterium]
MILELLSIIAPVFLIAAVGFAWARMGYDYDTAIITRLLTNITTPCLVFSRLTTLDFPLSQFGEIALITLAATLIWVCVGYVTLRATGIPRDSGLPPVIFPNCGNMGLAICLFAFGDVGLGMGLCFFVVTATLQFTVSPWLASGHFSLVTMLRSPIIYATLLSVVVMAINVEVPAWLTNTTMLLGNISIPMMLITLGVSLAGYGIVNLRNSLIVSLLRLGVGFASGLFLVWLLDIDGVMRGVILIMCSMPAAVFNYLFAQRYGKNPEEVAGTVILSTAMAFVLLPFLLLFVLES